MLKYNNLKHLFLLFGLLLPITWCGATSVIFKDGYSAIQVKGAHVQGVPRGSTIQASINSHTLTVVFSENIGEVAIVITTATGSLVENLWVITPDGLQTYLPLIGDYVITFTLSNGDEYYGEFTVTD